MDLIILVALTQRTPSPLFQVSGPPGTIEIMRGHDEVLDVGASTTFLGAAQQNPHLPPAHLGKQLRLFRLGIGVMDKRDLLLGNALSDEFGPDVLINILERSHFKRAGIVRSRDHFNDFSLCRRGCGQIAKN